MQKCCPPSSLLDRNVTRGCPGEEGEGIFEEQNFHRAVLEVLFFRGCAVQVAPGRVPCPSFAPQPVYMTETFFPCGTGDMLGENERLVGSRRLISALVVHSAQDLAVLRSPHTADATPKDRAVAPSVLQAGERKTSISF